MGIKLCGNFTKRKPLFESQKKATNNLSGKNRSMPLLDHLI